MPFKSSLYAPGPALEITKLAASVEAWKVECTVCVIVSLPKSLLQQVVLLIVTRKRGVCCWKGVRNMVPCLDTITLMLTRALYSWFDRLYIKKCHGGSKHLQSVVSDGMGSLTCMLGVPRKASSTLVIWLRWSPILSDSQRALHILAQTLSGRLSIQVRHCS